MKRTTNTPGLKSGGKVFWSDTEKQAVVRRAAEIHAERPDLAGLPLFREAMLTLPVGRRRKVIALSQVLWFEDSLAAEIKRRAREQRESDPLVTIVRSSNHHLASHNQTIEEWVREDVTWKAKVFAMHDQMVALLVQILGELKSLNASRSNQSPKMKINSARN